MSLIGQSVQGWMEALRCTSPSWISSPSVLLALGDSFPFPLSLPRIQWLACYSCKPHLLSHSELIIFFSRFSPTRPSFPLSRKAISSTRYSFHIPSSRKLSFTCSYDMLTVLYQYKKKKKKKIKTMPLPQPLQIILKDQPRPAAGLSCGNPAHPRNCQVNSKQSANSRHAKRVPSQAQYP